MVVGSLRRLVGVSVTALALVGAGVGTAGAAPAPDAGQQVNRRAAQATAGPRHNPLLKEILARQDEIGTRAPTVSAQCQQFIGKPSPYPPTKPNVDMIVGDHITSAGSSAGCPTAQNETAIASNPANPANIVAGANDYRVYNARESRNDAAGFAYTSTDGGRTWKNVLLPGLTYQTGAVGALRAMDGAGDPVISFGPNNTVYYGNIVFSRGAPAVGGTEAPSAIVVSISHDGGLTFGLPKIIQIDGVDARGNPTPTRVFNDKVWVAADPNSGRVYVTWTRFLDTALGDYAESPIVIAASIDRGATFTHFRRIDPVAGTTNPGLQPYSQGSNPRVGPDGTLYVAYETAYCASQACDHPNDRDVTVVATSTNRGASFSRSIVGTNYDFPFDDEISGEGLTHENFRINAFPQLTVDPVTGVVLVTWVDDRNGHYTIAGQSLQTNADNIVSSSTNGISWTRPVSVGTVRDEIFGAVASYGGTAAVVSYTRGYQPRGVRLDFAWWPLTATPGRPVTSATIHRVTSQSSDPRIQFPVIGADGRVLQGGFIGDYTGVSMGSDRRLHPAWTDFRGNPGTTTPNQDAYTRSIDLS